MFISVTRIDNKASPRESSTITSECCHTNSLYIVSSGSCTDDAQQRVPAPGRRSKALALLIQATQKGTTNSLHHD